MIKSIIQCLFSPRLYKIYGDGPREVLYEPLPFERVANQIITTAHSLLSISIYTSPFICFYIYKRGLLSLDEIKFLAQAFGGIGCFLALSLLFRGIGRASNPKYVEFLNVLNKPPTDQKVNLDAIRKYDFEFHAWPVSFSMPANNSSTWLENGPFKHCANPELPYYQRITVQLLAYIATHTFALRLIYPGTLGIVQNMLWPHLFEGRTQLVEKYKGKRAKVLTADGNIVDTMFVDKRNQTSTGQYIVICSEGNSGFYEIGIMTTPVKAGYSALGWNHPGFAGSTGVPFPKQEQNAIDAVIQYAVQELGYAVENIILFGWSIGGYSSAWAAVNYPDVMGLVLDASFDDLLPLAENQMPKSWSLLVKEVVRSFVNLNIADLLTKYSGPVQLVRRTEDEIICLRQGQLSTNRGNYLLLKLIETRNPELITTVNESFIGIFEKYIALTDQQRSGIVESELGENEQNVLKEISKYTCDYQSSHCTLLPDEYFTAIMFNMLKKKFNKKMNLRHLDFVDLKVTEVASSFRS